MAWFLNERRHWLGEGLDPKRYACDYVGSPFGVDITAKRTGPRKWLVFLLLALSARRRTLFRRYDLIVSSFPQVGFMVGLVNLLTMDRTPHVVWYFNCGHAYRGARRFLSRIFFREVRRFVVYTKKERKIYAEVFGLPEERFRFTFLTGADLDRERLYGGREAYGLEERYILSAGSSSRDYATLFRAVAGLDIQTVVVTHPYALRGLAVPDRVRIIESIPQEDYLKIIAEAELVVIPVSNRDTASGQMTLIQAMTLGVPVVATRCIGTEDYILDGKTGRFAGMGDAAGMRRAITDLLHDAGAREAMAERACAFAREHFLDEAASRVLEEIVAEMETGDELPVAGRT